MRKMTMNVVRAPARTNPISVLALLATTVATSACVDTQITGVIVEEDVEDPNLMVAFVRGINSELHDNMRDFSGVWWFTGSATDDFNNDGVSTNGEEILEYRNYSDRPGNFPWSQLHEAAWAGYYGVDVTSRVFADESTSHPLIARSWLVSGWAERMLGEIFCESIYNYEPGAGALMGPNDHLDPSRIVPVDSIMRRSVNAMQNALAIAEAAVANGAPTPDGDARIFDPMKIMYAAHGGIAQAAMLMGGLGSGGVACGAGPRRLYPVQSFASCGGAERVVRRFLPER